jgi:hypothetical protein
MVQPIESPSLISPVNTKSPSFIENKPSKPKKDQSKIDGFKVLTKRDKLKIVLYNLIEPLLLALIIASAMELSQMGTVIYMCVSMFFLLPMLLTQNADFVQVKSYFAMFLVFFAPLMTF